MLGVLCQAAFVCGSTWLLWKVVRRYTVHSVLDNLPGPPSPSFLHGQSTMSRRIFRVPYLPPGNLQQLYDKQGWDFHRELGEKYGHVVLLHGKFGVRSEYRAHPVLIPLNLIHAAQAALCL